MGHARALLGVQRKKDIEILRRKILKDNLSVRQTEYLAKQNETEVFKKKPIVSSNESKNIFLKSLEKNLGQLFGTKVEILSSKIGGKIVISYYSDEDLERMQEYFLSKG